LTSTDAESSNSGASVRAAADEAAAADGGAVVCRGVACGDVNGDTSIVDVGDGARDAGSAGDDQFDCWPGAPGIDATLRRPTSSEGDADGAVAVAADEPAARESPVRCSHGSTRSRPSLLVMTNTRASGRNT